MDAKKVNKRGKVIAMKEVTLPEILGRARDGRSYSEMARRCVLPVATVQRIEAGTVELPSRATLEALSRGYRIDLDELALAAYGRLFEEVPEGSDDTSALDSPPSADSNGRAWSRPGPKPKPVSALT